MHFVFQRFLGARYREQSKCGSIEDDERLCGKILKKRMQKENNRGASERHSRVTPIAERLRRHGADQKVASDSSRQRRGECKDHQAEQIEVAGDGGGGAFDREEESSGNICHGQKSIVAYERSLSFVVRLRHLLSLQEYRSILELKPRFRLDSQTAEQSLRAERARFHSLRVLRVEAGPDARLDAL